MDETNEGIPETRGAKKKQGGNIKNPMRNPTIIQHPFDYPDEYLLQTYNLNRAAIQELLYIIGPHIGNGVNITYTTERKLAAALYYYYTGAPIKSANTALNLNLYPCNCVRGLREVTTEMDKYAADILIDFPHTDKMHETVQQRYLMTTGLSGVIGSMDCFHVQIGKPSYQLDANEYMSSFGFYSKHVQIISDYDMNILGCFARYGGSCNESEIWEKSVVRKYMQKLHNENENECFLVASSNYPQEPWLLTPTNDMSMRAQTFNECHKKAHLPVGRLIAILREEFGCLSPKGLRLYPGYAGAVINCCCALHNLRKKHNLPMPDIVDENLSSSALEYIMKAKATIKRPAKTITTVKTVNKKRTKKSKE